MVSTDLPGIKRCFVVAGFFFVVVIFIYLFFVVVVAVISMLLDCIMQLRSYLGHREGFILPVY